MWTDTDVCQLPAWSARNLLPRQKLVWGWKELNSKRSGRMRTFLGMLDLLLCEQDMWFLVRSFASSACALWKSLGPWPSWQRDLFLFWLLDRYQRRRSLMTSSLLELQKRETQVILVQSEKKHPKQTFFFYSLRHWEYTHTLGNKSVTLILSDRFRWGSGDYKVFLESATCMHATSRVCVLHCITLTGYYAAE